MEFNQFARPAALIKRIRPETFNEVPSEPDFASSMHHHRIYYTCDADHIAVVVVHTGRFGPHAMHAYVSYVPFLFIFGHKFNTHTYDLYARRAVA